MCNKHSISQWNKATMGSVLGSSIGLGFGGPVGMLVGGGIGFGAGATGSNPLNMSAEDWQNFQKYHGIIADPLGLGLTDYSGQLVERIGGGDRKLQKVADQKEKAAEIARTPNKPPEAPQPTASLLDPNAELRDKRRRAALLGISQLRVPGNGIATGSPGGANLPLG